MHWQAAAVTTSTETIGSNNAVWSGPAALGTDGSIFRALTPRRYRGTMLVLPGGGYVMRADYEADPVAEWLAGLGIASGVVDYTVRRLIPTRCWDRCGRRWRSPARLIPITDPSASSGSPPEVTSPA